MGCDFYCECGAPVNFNETTQQWDYGCNCDMPKEEINKKISVLRGWHSHTCEKCIQRGDLGYVIGPLPESDGDVIQDEYPDWHSDKLWPALLKEMPMPMVWKNPNGEWTCEANIDNGPGEADDVIASALTLMEAVCNAWLEWKDKK